MLTLLVPLSLTLLPNCSLFVKALAILFSVKSALFADFRLSRLSNPVVLMLILLLGHLTVFAQNMVNTFMTLIISSTFASLPGFVYLYLDHIIPDCCSVLELPLLTILSRFSKCHLLLKAIAACPLDYCLLINCPCSNFAFYLVCLSSFVPFLEFSFTVKCCFPVCSFISIFCSTYHPFITHFHIILQS